MRQCPVPGAARAGVCLAPESQLLGSCCVFAYSVMGDACAWAVRVHVWQAAVSTGQDCGCLRACTCTRNGRYSYLIVAGSIHPYMPGGWISPPSRLSRPGTACCTVLYCGSSVMLLRPICSNGCLFVSTEFIYRSIDLPYLYKLYDNCM